MQRLAGKIALVTGAGAGIGLATAGVFAAEGAHIYVTDVNGEAAAEAVAALTAKGHRRNRGHDGRFPWPGRHRDDAVDREFPR